jgi:hypothetical protein
MTQNRSMTYLLPLIDGWSSKADRPINCYAKAIETNLVILYGKDDVTHNDGALIWQNEKYICLSHNFRTAFKDDVQLIKDGRYSQISDRAKSLILSRSEDLNYDFLEGVLYKSKTLKRGIERSLGIENIDAITNEYDSKLFAEEIFNPDKL